MPHRVVRHRGRARIAGLSMAERCSREPWPGSGLIRTGPDAGAVAIRALLVLMAHLPPLRTTPSLRDRIHVPWVYSSRLHGTFAPELWDMSHQVTRALAAQECRSSQTSQLSRPGVMA
jgi:hypothetical protein